jgi:hypothetical protein
MNMAEPIKSIQKIKTTKKFMIYELQNLKQIMERVSLWKSVKDDGVFPQRNAHPLPRDRRFVP